MIPAFYLIFTSDSMQEIVIQSSSSSKMIHNYMKISLLHQFSVFLANGIQTECQGKSSTNPIHNLVRYLRQPSCISRCKTVAEMLGAVHVSTHKREYKYKDEKEMGNWGLMGSVSSLILRKFVYIAGIGAESRTYSPVRTPYRAMGTTVNDNSRRC